MPDSLCQLGVLTFLQMQHNLISAVPVDVANLASLSVLSLHHNRLSALPITIGEGRAPHSMTTRLSA